MAPDELPEDGPAAIIGYSEGGAAAAWAAQLQPAYAPDVALSAVAAGAAAADVEIAGPSLDGSFFSFFIAYGGIGYAAAYPELDLDSYLTPRAAAGIEALRDSSILQAIISGPTIHPRGRSRRGPTCSSSRSGARRLRENRLGGIAPAGSGATAPRAPRPDRVVRRRAPACGMTGSALGADVRLYVTRGGVDHISGAVAGTPVALDWIGRRLAREVRMPEPASIVDEVESRAA